MSRKEKTKYQLMLFHETPNAILCGREKSDRENDKAFWLPKSQVDIEVEFTHKGSSFVNVLVPEWLAEEKGLDASLEGIGPDEGDGSDGDLIE